MSRILVIPAAGLGSRLGAAVPKLFVPVAGVPMIDRLAQLYLPYVARIVLIAHPSFAARLRQHVEPWPLPVDVAVQERPTGMLDAILLGADPVRSTSSDEVWITWCDQVGVHPETIHRLSEALPWNRDVALALPTVAGEAPYIHFARNHEGRITEVLHRREGDAMPAEGESDMGLFALTRAAYLNDLPAYAVAPGIGRVTGERNFLPFIPWLAARRAVMTFPAVDALEAVGVNTPDDLARVERYLGARTGPSS